jgi:hypothetical protein
VTASNHLETFLAPFPDGGTCYSYPVSDIYVHNLQGHILLQAQSFFFSFSFRIYLPRDWLITTPEFKSPRQLTVFKPLEQHYIYNIANISDALLLIYLYTSIQVYSHLISPHLTSPHSTDYIIRRSQVGADSRNPDVTRRLSVGTSTGT